MKIGILTLHCAHNYGAVLQCYALQQYLRAAGHDAVVVDYCSEAITRVYECDLWAGLRALKAQHKDFRSFRTALYPLLHRWWRRQLFERWSRRYLKTAPVDQTEYDVLVYGSDQLWNKKIMGDDKTYWGVHHLRARKHITYSISAGNVENISQDDMKFVTEALKKFSALAVREPALGDLLQPHTSVKIHHTVDPVFLLDAESWKRHHGKRKPKEKYILSYNIQEEPSVQRMAESLRELTGYKIIELRASVWDDDRLHPDRYPCASPADFVNLIQNAEMVFTSSFHGVAFSVLFIDSAIK